MSLCAHSGQSRFRSNETMPIHTRWRAGTIAVLGLGLVMIVGGCAKSVDDQLAEARIQVEIGSYDEAIETLRSLLETEPNHADANLLLGQTQLALGQPALAIWPLELATRSAEQAPVANLALGAAFLQLAQFESALEAVDRTLATENLALQTRLGALRLLAAIHLEQEDYEAVIADVDQLLEAAPEDPAGLALRANALLGLGRAEEAANAMLEIWNSPSLSESDAAARAGMGLVKVYRNQLDDEERAEAQLTAVLERFPGRRSVMQGAMDYYDRHGKSDEAVAMLRAALDRDPSDFWILGTLAERLADAGRGEEARELVTESVELLDTPSAWMTLALLERKLGNFEEALIALEKTFSMIPGVPDNLMFTHANILADAKQLDRAEEVASGIKEDFYREIVMGRIEFERGNDRKALALLTSGLRRWPNNAGARYLAGKAAMRSGQVDRGIGELREATRVGTGETDAPLDLAKIYLAQGKPKAADSTLRFVTRDGEGPRYWPATRLRAVASWEAGSKDKATQLLEQMAAVDEHKRDAVVTLADLRSRDGGPAVGAGTIQGGKLDLVDPENEPALRALASYLTALGDAEKALAEVDAAVKAHPDFAPFHDLRARVLWNLDRSEDAEKAFDRALEIDPELATAVAGRSALAEARGDLGQARELMARATELDEGNAEFPYTSAQLALMQGDTEGAKQALEETLRRNPFHGNACNDFAWILAEENQNLDRALALAKRARETESSAAILDTLGWVQLRRGEAPDAVVTLEEAHALDPESPSIAYRLGLALSRMGEAERARSLWQEALASGPFPESDAAQDQLAQLDAGAS